MDIPQQGQFLISEPYLSDNNFHRSVVLITDHNEGAHTGFVLNKESSLNLQEIIGLLQAGIFTLYLGGPVAIDSLNFIHRKPDLIPGGVEFMPGIYLGGDFDKVSELIFNRKLIENDIRFFLGYSGWSPGQLVDEIKEQSWFIATAYEDLIFSIEPTFIWKDCLKRMGGKYELLINSPDNPQWN